MGFKIHKMGDIPDNLVIAFAKEVYAANLQEIGDIFHDRKELLVFNRFYEGLRFKTKVYYHCENGIIVDMSSEWEHFMTRSENFTPEFL